MLPHSEAAIKQGSSMLLKAPEEANKALLWDWNISIIEQNTGCEESRQHTCRHTVKLQSSMLLKATEGRRSCPLKTPYFLGYHTEAASSGLRRQALTSIHVATL